MKRASIPSKKTPVKSGSAMNLQQLREHVRKTQGDVARKAAVTDLRSILAASIFRSVSAVTRAAR